MTRTAPSPAEHPVSMADVLDRWVRQGLVTAEQAVRLRADLAAHGDVVRVPQPRAATPSKPLEHPGGSDSLLTEALSYVGGVLVLVAGGLLTARVWDDLGYGSRVLLAAAATLVLLGSGLVVPSRLGPPGERVRSVLWVLSTAGLAGLLALVAVDGFDLTGLSVGILVSGGAAVYAAALYWRQRSVLQQLALLVACLGFVATAATQLFDGDGDGVVPGLGLLVVSGLWGAGAARGVLTPRRTAVAASAAGGLVGAVVVSVEGRAWAHLLAVAVVALVVVVAVRRSDLVVLGIGTFGALQLLPRAVTYFFPGVVAAAVVVLLAGIGLIVAGLGIANRRAKARAGRPA